MSARVLATLFKVSAPIQSPYAISDHFSKISQSWNSDLVGLEDSEKEIRDFIEKCCTEENLGVILSHCKSTDPQVCNSSLFSPCFLYYKLKIIYNFVFFCQLLLYIGNILSGIVKTFDLGVECNPKVFFFFFSSFVSMLIIIYFKKKMYNDHRLRLLNHCYYWHFHLIRQ